ncbi:MAG: alpha/beta hydrolase [Pseudomonadales bacterium]
MRVFEVFARAVTGLLMLILVVSGLPGGETAMATEQQITEHDEPWARGDAGPLQARIYRPAAAAGPLPALLDVHGGAWSAFDRTAGALYDRALAARGFLVVAIDFRQGPEHQHPAASRDVAGAVRWLRLNAGRLGADVSRIGLIGSSSGGHLALLAGVWPDVAAHQGTQIFVGDAGPAAHDEVSARVDYVVALWPVSDPFFRYRYARRAGIDRLVKAHDGYYGSESAMREASVPRIVVAGEAQQLPDVLVVQPGEDSNVPVEMTFELLRAWQSRGGYIEYAYFPDQPHAFGHRPSPATSRMIALVEDFARRQLGGL